MMEATTANALGIAASGAAAPLAALTKPEAAEAKTYDDGKVPILEDNFYQIRPGTSTTKAVSCYPGSHTQKPYIWDKNSNPDQYFYLQCVDRANNVYKLFIARHVEDKHGLNQGNNDKSTVWLYNDDDTSCAKWKVEKSGSLYKLHPMNATGYSLSWANGTDNGKVLSVKPNSSASNQTWCFDRWSGNRMRLASSFTSTESNAVFVRFLPSYNNSGNWIEWMSSDSLPNGGWCQFENWIIGNYSSNMKKYDTNQGSWGRWGVTIGGGTTSPGGGGFGCEPKVGFCASGNHLANHGGPDKEQKTHVWIYDNYWKSKHKFGEFAYFPRVNITYDLCGGTHGSISSHYKLLGHESWFSKAIPWKQGQWFTGWETSSSGPAKVAPMQVMGYGNMNFTQEPRVAWGWNDNDGTASGSPILVNASQTGYDMYRQSPAGTHKSTLALYAVWAAITFKVGYVGNGARSGSMADSTYTYGAAGTLRANAFKNWAVLTITLDPANASSKSTVNVTRPFSRWATYTPTSAQGTTAAKYFADKATVKNWFTEPYKIEKLWAEWGAAVYTLPSPTKKGYNFQGFYTAASGGSKVGDAGAKVSMTADTTAIGRWQKAVIRVHYMADGEEMYMHENVQCDFAYTLSADGVAACKREGCAGITDFYTDATYKAKWENGSAAPRKDLYLYCRNKVTLKVGLVDEAKAFFDRHDVAEDAAGITPWDYAAYPKAVTSGNQLYYGDSARADDVCGMPDAVWVTDQLARSVARIPGGYASKAALHSDAAKESFTLNSNAAIWYAYDLPSFDGFTAE